MIITYVSGSRDVNKVTSGVCDFMCVCVSVYLCVRALTEKRLELSTPNLADIQYTAVARGQKVKGQCHVISHCTAGVGVYVNMAAWVSL